MQNKQIIVDVVITIWLVITMIFNYEFSKLIYINNFSKLKRRFEINCCNMIIVLIRLKLMEVIFNAGKWN